MPDYAGNAAKGAIAGYTAGKTFGVVPGLMWAAGGAWGNLENPGDDDNGGSSVGFGDQVYYPSKGSFQMPSSDDWFSTYGGNTSGGGFCARQPSVQDAPTKYFDQGRGYAYGARGSQQSALDLLGEYAAGRKSASRLAAADALQKTQAQIAAQAASGAGGPRASTNRAAIYAQSGAGQSIAGQVASKAAAEQLAAQQAYLSGASQMRSGDISQQQAEANWYGQQMQGRLGIEKMRQNLLQMGLSDKQATQQALMAYEALKSKQSLGAQQLNLQQWIAQNSKDEADRQFWSNLLMGALNSGSKAISAGVASSGDGGGGGGGGSGYDWSNYGSFFGG